MVFKVSFIIIYMLPIQSYDSDGRMVRRVGSCGALAGE